MVSLFRGGQRSFKTTHMLYQSVTGLTALEELIDREDIKMMNFSKDVIIGNYKFQYFSKAYGVGLQIDSLNSYEEDVYNMEGIKQFSIPSLNINVLKISDYQLLTDLDEIARVLRRIKARVN